MNQQTTPPVYPFPYLQALPPADDEIDLVELMRRIWAGRYQILAITLVFIALAGAYAFTAKQVWTSRAVLVKPRLEELGSYYQVTQQLKRTLGNSIPGSIKLEADKIAEQVFSELTTQADSADLRRAFWEKSDYFAKEASGEESQLDKDKVLAELVGKNIELTPADEVNKKYTSLTLAADAPDVAKQLLEQYLSQLNTQIWSSKVNELQTEINNLAADLQQEKKSLESKALAAQKNQLESAKNALAMAQNAGIENLNAAAVRSRTSNDTSNGDSVADNMLFLLGTKALNAQVINLTTKAPTLPVRYFEIERQLKELAALPKPGQDMKSYRYLQAPNTPLTKDKPKRILIMVLGGTLGFMLGILYVLVAGLFLRGNEMTNKDLPIG